MCTCQTRVLYMFVFYFFIYLYIFFTVYFISPVVWDARKQRQPVRTSPLFPLVTPSWVGDRGVGGASSRREEARLKKTTRRVAFTPLPPVFDLHQRIKSTKTTTNSKPNQTKPNHHKRHLKRSCARSFPLPLPPPPPPTSFHHPPPHTHTRTPPPPLPPFCQLCEPETGRGGNGRGKGREGVNEKKEE